MVWRACVGLLAAGVVAAQTDRTPVSLIVSHATVVTMDPAGRTIPDGAVAIDGRTIAAVGTVEEIAARFSAAESIDARGQVVLPGLINTHTHAPMVLYRGLADDLALMEWLEKYIFPAEAKTLTPEFVRAGTKLAALEMIRSGTTAYADMYYFEEEIARVTRDAGLRAVLGQTIIRFPVADASTPAQGLARGRAFVKEFAGDDLITPALAPHAMYTLDGAMLKAIKDAARRDGAPLMIHLAETREEVDIARKQHKATPVQYLDSIGFWGAASPSGAGANGPPTLAAHAVHVSPADIRILAARGIGVSHNPESNMKLASGIAPVPAMRQARIPVGLGTDGAASNNDLDMFEAMRQAALLHKVSSGDPRVLPARTALEMATIEGARALGLDRIIGSLEAGKRADLIVVSMTSARQTPMYDPISHLVYVTRGDDVEATIVNGRVLMRDRKVLTLDESAVLADAGTQAARVRAAVGR
jgi:5-methylthioadenosine/S-adenosylhomocysteine deaminase